MSPKRSSELDTLLEEILTDANGEAEQLCALRDALVRAVPVPCPASLVGKPVRVQKFDYDGNSRRGLTAKVIPAGLATRVVSAADVVLDDPALNRYLDAYRQWMGLPPLQPEPSVETIDLVVLYLGDRLTRCRLLTTGADITLRGWKMTQVVPGEIATVRPSAPPATGRKPAVSGRIVSTRLDVTALGLKPLELRPEGEWDPADEYWGERGEPLPARTKKLIKRGPRPQFEMEQIIPGHDPDDPWSDPILVANDKKDSGDKAGAAEVLMQLCLADLRCLDAHAHLGNLYFDAIPHWAIRHYEVGFRIGELSLPDGFDGVLPWKLIDNRPFLRCMHGYGLCLWRLKRFEESAAIFDRILWLNPTDNQGVRFLIDEVHGNRAWTPDM